MKVSEAYESARVGNIREIRKRNIVTEATFDRWQTKVWRDGGLRREAASRARAGERPAQADGG